VTTTPFAIASGLAQRIVRATGDVTSAPITSSGLASFVVSASGSATVAKGIIASGQIFSFKRRFAFATGKSGNGATLFIQNENCAIIPIKTANDAITSEWSEAV